MAKQLGYRSKAFRGATEIPAIKSITPPKATRDEIDVTALDATDYEREFLLGFKTRANAIYEGFYNQGNAVHEQIEEDFNDGLSTPESWSHAICDNDSGATLRTYAYSGTIAKCDVGPISTEDPIALVVEIKTTGSITIT